MPTKPWNEIRNESKLTEEQRAATEARVQEELLRMSLNEDGQAAGRMPTRGKGAAR
jgi:hypothetical protein